MFIEYINSKHLNISPKTVYDCFKERNWKKIKSEKKHKSVEDMVNSLYNIHVKAGFISIKSNNKSKTSKQKKVPHKSKKEHKEKWFPYEEQLKDSRWFAFREKVFSIRGRKCEHCGSTECLQVHHLRYEKGKLAWEYSYKEVIVLCKDCHKKIHNIE